ncbi:hypothetical protein O3P69_003161 [Scylla paramamosain]|uniref:Uncharacterized protein n=1 Tax=Scylla paramamosain TaxID=85552 RepID=A0AAW0UMQ8_SCYPA
MGALANWSCTFPGREEWPVWDTKGRPGNPPASSSQALLGPPRSSTFIFFPFSAHRYQECIKATDPKELLH